MNAALIDDIGQDVNPVVLTPKKWNHKRSGFLQAHLTRST
jgi:hypothetical protein